MTTTPKAFTDEDLDRWKYALQNIWAFKLSRQEAEALIHRLERAEHLISVSPKSGRDITSYWEAFDEWLKSAGKDSH